MEYSDIACSIWTHISHIADNIAVVHLAHLINVKQLLTTGPSPLTSIRKGSIFRLREQKLVKNNKDNQIQNITLSNMYFLKEVYAVHKSNDQVRI